MSTTYGYATSPYAKRIPLKARTRALLAGGVRMGTINGDTGRTHGPLLKPPAFFYSRAR